MCNILVNNNCMIYYEIFSGIGYGLSFSPTIVVLNTYFEEKRSLANGIAVSGGSIGQLVLPPIFRLAIEKYSIRGAMMVFAGFGLQIVCSGAVFRPLSYYERNKKYDIYQDASTDSGVGIEEPPCEVNLSPGLQDFNGNQKATQLKVTFQDNDNDNTQLESDILIAKESETDDILSPIHFDRASIASDISEISAKYTSLMSSTGSVCIVPKKKEKKTKVTFLREPESKRNETIVAKTGSSYCFGKNCKKPNIGAIFQFSLFRKPLFIIYIISIVLGNLGFLNPLLFVPSYAKDLGESPQIQALLVSVIGATDFVGRIAGGWFGNLGIVKRYKIMAISHMITGTTLIVTQFFPSLAGLFIISVVEGLIGGTALSQMAVVLVDFLGIESLSASHGLTMMMIGLGQIGMPSFIGKRCWN